MKHASRLSFGRESERRSARELELAKIRDAYANAATTEAQLRMKREMEKLEARSI